MGRFKKGVRFSCYRPTRGPGRGDYDMSRTAYQARLANLRGWERRHTYSETWRLKIEIALGTHRGESYRKMARRLGLRSHAHCWRVARNYRTGQIPMLPRDEQGLVEMRESLDKPATRQQAVQAAPWWMAREWRSRDEIWGCTLLTQEQKVQAAAELDRKRTS